MKNYIKFQLIMFYIYKKIAKQSQTQNNLIHDLQIQWNKHILVFPFEWFYTSNFGALHSLLFGVSQGSLLKTPVGITYCANRLWGQRQHIDLPEKNTSQWYHNQLSFIGSVHGWFVDSLATSMQSEVCQCRGVMSSLHSASFCTLLSWLHTGLNPTWMG